MSRMSKFLLLITLIVFILACNTVTKPITDVQNGVSTVQSVASSMPIETLQAITTNMPDLASTIEAAGTDLPDLGQMENPQGTPATEWNGIPIMSQASAGQEFADASSYSFKGNMTVQEVQDYYNSELVKLGWNSMASLPGSSTGATLLFSKDNSLLTIAVNLSNGETVVIVTLIGA